MNEFEKACNTENYTGDSTQECVIEWLRGDKEVTATFANNTKYCNKVKRLAEECPDEVKIVHENLDGSIVAHLPLSYIKVSRPKQVSEEFRIAAAERLAKVRTNNIPLDDLCNKDE